MIPVHFFLSFDTVDMAKIVKMRLGAVGAGNTLPCQIRLYVTANTTPSLMSTNRTVPSKPPGAINAARSDKG
jgi:hypothetical protein